MNLRHPARDHHGLRWWGSAEMPAYRGPDVFGPRDLADRLAVLLAG